MFLEEFFSFFVVYYLLVEVAVVCELHDNAQIFTFQEDLLIADDVFILETG